MGGAIRENLGYRDFKYRYWKKNPGCRDFKIPVLEKNSGYRDFKIMVLEKNPGYRDFKSSTENRVESLYNRENFPGASRPSKTLTGVLRERQSGLSLGGGGFAVGFCLSVKKDFFCAVLRSFLFFLSHKKQKLC